MVTETLPTKTVTVPAPANTRIVASPAPLISKKSATPSIPRTTSVEMVTEEEVPVPVQPASTIEEEEEYIEEPRYKSRPRRTPNRWWGW